MQSACPIMENIGCNVPYTLPGKKSQFYLCFEKAEPPFLDEHFLASTT